MKRLIIQLSGADVLPSIAYEHTSPFMKSFCKYLHFNRNLLNILWDSSAQVNSADQSLVVVSNMIFNEGGNEVIAMVVSVL